MFEIVIKEAGEEAIVGKLPDGSYLIGSGDDCHIPLPRPEISANHAQFIVKGNSLKVIDWGSSNGTFINENQLISNEAYKVAPGAIIRIGKITIEVKGQGENRLDSISLPDDEVAPPVEKVIPKPQVPAPRSFAGDDIPLLRISGIPPEARALVQEVKRRAHVELLKRLNLKKLVLAGISDEELESQAKMRIREILSELTIPLPDGVELDAVEQELVNEAIGLGPLEYLTDDDEITEIMVNGPDQVFVEKAGTLYRTDTAFADSNQVMAAIERIVSPLGRRIDESSPMVDARLPDGSRVNAIIPPLSLVGPSITIRKFSKIPLEAADLIRFGSVSEDIIKFLSICVQVRKNIIISGGTGSGKTTFLNVLSSFLPNRERIVTIEDAAELQLHQEHIVRLESRPPNIEGKGEIAIRDLVRNSLRMRPDRIVIGECRGGEALDMLQAMNTGHDGSLTTIHANTPRDALSRLETLVLMAGFDLPLRAIREQIASAITIIVQINREKDGTRKVTHVSEITKMEGEIITMQDIFKFHQDGWDENDKIVGRHLPTGSVPTFMDEIRRAKLDLDISMFTKG
jgi:pilus assembly protein CpaF